MEHEVAKLIGAPPGYLGHRETQPLLSQQKVNAAASEYSDLTILLFDEIEKAAPSMTRLLLGILDKAVLRLGDNNTVNFENTLIFMTSNLGARDMNRELRPEFGFEAMVPSASRGGKLESIALHAVKKRFSPEFVNRIDAIVTYKPLAADSIALILDQHLDDLQTHIEDRLGDRAFRLDVPARTRKFLLKRGVSNEYGARELKRTLQRELIQPLANLVAAGMVEPGVNVKADLNDAKDRIVLKAAA
jgi:ATP-dependent Clp protease ATP-binding subunit ClpA